MLGRVAAAAQRQPLELQTGAREAGQIQIQLDRVGGAAQAGIDPQTELAQVQAIGQLQLAAVQAGLQPQLRPAALQRAAAVDLAGQPGLAAGQPQPGLQGLQRAAAQRELPAVLAAGTARRAGGGKELAAQAQVGGAGLSGRAGGCADARIQLGLQHAVGSGALGRPLDLQQAGERHPGQQAGRDLEPGLAVQCGQPGAGVAPGRRRGRQAERQIHPAVQTMRATLPGALRLARPPERGIEALQRRPALQLPAPAGIDPLGPALGLQPGAVAADAQLLEVDALGRAAHLQLQLQIGQVLAFMAAAQIGLQGRARRLIGMVGGRLAPAQGQRAAQPHRRCPRIEPGRLQLLQRGAQRQLEPVAAVRAGAAPAALAEHCAGRAAAIVQHQAQGLERADVGMRRIAGRADAQRLQRQALPVEPPGLPVGQVDLQLQRRGCTAAGAGAAGAAGAARLEPGLDAAAQRGLRQPARQRRQIDLLQPGLQPGERLRLLRPQLGLGLERLAACEQLHLGLQPGQRTAQAQIELPVGRQRGVAAAAAAGARLGSGAELRLHRQRRGRADLEPAAQLQLIAAQPDRVEPVQAGGSGGQRQPGRQILQRLLPQAVQHQPADADLVDVQRQRQHQRARQHRRRVVGGAALQVERPDLQPRQPQRRRLAARPVEHWRAPGQAVDVQRLARAERVAQRADVQVAGQRTAQPFDLQRRHQRQQPAAARLGLDRRQQQRAGGQRQQQQGQQHDQRAPEHRARRRRMGGRCRSGGSGWAVAVRLGGRIRHQASINQSGGQSSGQ